MDTWRSTKLGTNLLFREGAPLLGLYWLYSTIRWLTARDSPYEAFDNAFKIIRLERQLGIFHELTIQRWLIDHARGIVNIANDFYTIGYFPVLILCSVLLYRFKPERFSIFKMSFLLGLGFALVCFTVFPLAPPRLLPEVGFVDTQQVFGSSLYNQKSVLSFYNPYAAMPSLHFGWALLVGIMACGFERRVFKALGVLYPCCMALVIVTTGHHYFLDIVGGGIVVGLAYTLVKTFTHIIPEPESCPAGLNGNIRIGEKLARPHSPRRSTDHIDAPWSREQRDYAQRKLHSTIMTWLTRWRPPS
jgi:membrane-associated phospholipid phosphatase